MKKKTAETMKDIILKFLMDNTDLMHKYTGGGDEPIMIVFPYHELESWTDEEKKAQLTVIAERLSQSLKEMESDKDRRIKELEEACIELNRFIPELRYLSESGFQYPDNAIKALTQIEKLLNPIS